MTPAQQKRFLPENYEAVLEYMRFELGGSCSDDWRIIQELAAHMGWSPRAAYGVLGILTKQGYLRREKTGKRTSFGRPGARWVLVKSGEEAA